MTMNHNSQAGSVPAHLVIQRDCDDIRAVIHKEIGNSDRQRKSTVSLPRMPSSEQSIDDFFLFTFQKYILVM
jgi:hypothetical protein